MSYLLARLELAVHISKTAFERLKPAAQIERISHFDSNFTAGQWIFTEERDYFANLDLDQKRLALYELPKKSLN
ncbi:MAG: hypothetical protein DWQ10_11180 [Calditrichaeota bacterium]|nr:MAG: hypothetical protein DWQ10_11180 [Calditrichota bacterium]